MIYNKASLGDRDSLQESFKNYQIFIGNKDQRSQKKQ